jgi:molybdopterin-binding protein
VAKWRRRNNGGINNEMAMKISNGVIISNGISEMAAEKRNMASYHQPEK